MTSLSKVQTDHSRHFFFFCTFPDSKKRVLPNTSRFHFAPRSVGHVIDSREVSRSGSMNLRAYVTASYPRCMRLESIYDKRGIRTDAAVQVTDMTL